MGLRFRKVLNAGPLRLNISRGGLGASLGLGFVRFTLGADGRRYLTLSLPGTGLSWYFPITRRPRP
jgi:hypothetical protein